MLNTLKRLNDNARAMLDEDTKKELGQKVEMLAEAAKLKKQIDALERKYGDAVTQWALEYSSQDIKDEVRDTKTALKYKDSWDQHSDEEKDRMMHVANNS